MESVACSCCGSLDAEVVFVGRDLLHGLPGDFPVRHCRDCGAFYLSPRPTQGEIAYYYPEDYAPHNIAAVADHRTAWARWNLQYAMNKRLRAVSPYVREPGRVLDLGCATGNFLDNMRRLGWKPFGVEPNQSAAAYARERFGLEIFCGELEQAGYPEGLFDLVTLWDVLEHLHNPHRTLMEVARVTKAGGMLAINVPNPDGIEARLFGPYWAGWDVPRHLMVFPRPTLLRMLATLGFDQVKVTSFINNTGGLPLSLQFWLGVHTQYMVFPQLATKLMTSWPARLALTPYYSFLSRFNIASSMTIVAWRDAGPERE